MIDDILTAIGFIALGVLFITLGVLLGTLIANWDRRKGNSTKENQ